jgi:peptidase M23-like protein
VLEAVSTAGVITLCLLWPSVLLFWLLRSQAQSRVYLASLSALAFVVLVVLSRSILGAWYVVGTFWPWVLGGALLGILIQRARRGIPRQWLPSSGRESFLLLLVVLLLAIWSLPLPFLMRAKAYEGEPVQLSPPLGGANFFVMGGGANWSVNHHAFISYQRYALDIMQQDALGFRASVMFPSHTSDFYAFGARIVAPCDGEVLATKDGLPNRMLMNPDTENPFGNHVVLFCQGHSILLGHMQAGSVAVNVGDDVKTGQPLGLVGNSGSTLEPHLHIHAVQGRHDDGRGMASPLMIGGKLLAKGDTLN